LSVKCRFNLVLTGKCIAGNVGLLIDRPGKARKKWHVK